ncbi:MAG: hypothetical protein WHT46_02405 [Candidatus Geothermincolales bacterium]
MYESYAFVRPPPAEQDERGREILVDSGFSGMLEVKEFPTISGEESPELSHAAKGKDMS